jgi:hypothetical protein
MPRLPRHGKIFKNQENLALWAGKTFSLGREKKIDGNILKFLVKIFGSMKNIY